MRFRSIYGLAIVACLGPICVLADPWDDLASAFVAQEHGRLVERRGSADEPVILLSQDLAALGVVIAVVDGAPGITFRLARGAPSEAAYAMMARSAARIASVEPEGLGTALHEAYRMAVESHGVGLPPYRPAIVSCIDPAAADGISFTVIRSAPAAADPAGASTFR